MSSWGSIQWKSFRIQKPIEIIQKDFLIQQSSRCKRLSSFLKLFQVKHTQWTFLHKNWLNHHKWRYIIQTAVHSASSSYLPIAFSATSKEKLPSTDNKPYPIHQYLYLCFAYAFIYPRMRSSMNRFATRTRSTPQIANLLETRRRVYSA